MSEKKENLKFALILLLHLISIQRSMRPGYPYYLSGLACAVLCFFATFLEIALFKCALQASDIWTASHYSEDAGDGAYHG